SGPDSAPVSPGLAVASEPGPVSEPRAASGAGPPFELRAVSAAVWVPGLVLPARTPPAGSVRRRSAGSAARAVVPPARPGRPSQPARPYGPAYGPAPSARRP